jgi:hypothetical protein
MGKVVNVTLQPLYPWERDLVPILQEAGRAPGLAATGMKNRTVQHIASRHIKHQAHSNIKTT